MDPKHWYVDIAGRRIGLEIDTIQVQGQPYMDRWILYVFGPCIRLHRFHRGDDDRAVHDHPWNFVTFPFVDYDEVVGDPEDPIATLQTVKAFRFHYRPAEYRHYVIGRSDHKKKPFWTLVLASGYKRSWGFWPFPKMFVPWRKWT